MCDPSKLGCQCFITILVELSIKDYNKEFDKKTSKFPGVHDLIRLSGSFDLMIVSHIKNCNEIITIHEEIAKSTLRQEIEAAISPVLHLWPDRRSIITTF
jgi:DNA-binding Lrp family transcriptional regulator